jgi:hypothetical protein
MTYSAKDLFTARGESVGRVVESEGPVVGVGANHQFVAACILQYYQAKKLMYLAPAAKLPFLQKSVPEVEVVTGDRENLQGMSSLKVHSPDAQQQATK